MKNILILLFYTVSITSAFSQVTIKKPDGTVIKEQNTKMEYRIVESTSQEGATLNNKRMVLVLVVTDLKDTIENNLGIIIEVEKKSNSKISIISLYQGKDLFSPRVEFTVTVDLVNKIVKQSNGITVTGRVDYTDIVNYYISKS